MENEETKTVVLNQIDTIISKYSPERGEKFFCHDIYTYLLTVGARFCGIVESQELQNKIYQAFAKEAFWYKNHNDGCDYCKSTIIQSRLVKLRNKVDKMLTPKQTQAERNAEFQEKVIDLLTKMLNAIKNEKDNV